MNKTAEETLYGKAGSAYIPPAKLKALQAQITDKSSVEYQKLTWEGNLNGLN